MCRQLAYLGAPVRIGELLQDPPSALVRQAWAPRRQTHGVMNVDGFGVGWYLPGDPEPARHRGEGPIWADETFPDLARTVRTGALLAAVRSATIGTVHGRAAAAPFRSGRWLFGHNGALAGWPDSAADLVKDLSPASLLRLEAPTDAAMLWALTLERLERGAPAGEALAGVVQRAASTCGGRINLLLHDGATIAGTTWGEGLCWRRLAGGVVIASEPYDDDPGWHEVPDAHLITATIHPLAAIDDERRAAIDRTAAIDDDREIRVTCEPL